MCEDSEPGWRGGDHGPRTADSRVRGHYTSPPTGPRHTRPHPPHSARLAKWMSGFPGSSVVPGPGSADLRAATDHVGMLRCWKITRRAVEVLTMVREPPMIV